MSRSGRWGSASLAVLLSFAAGCGGGGSSPAPAASPSPLASPIPAGLLLPPAGSIYFGAFVNASGLQHGTSPISVGAFETQIGRKLAIDSGYLAFTSKFGTRNELDDYANGRIPIYSWNCQPPNAQIASGAYDASIRLQADAVKTYGWPVFVRYMWDPDLPASQLGRATCYDPATDLPNKVFSPAEYVAAFQHIRAIFRQEGAVNSVFVWSISSVGANSAAYYPGDADVDWVGGDVYDLPNVSFTATYAATYALLAQFGKPIMISETGAMGPEQPSFFPNAATNLRTVFPLVKAYVYYDAIGPQADWRITPSAQAVFDAFAQDPYVRGYVAAP